MPVPSQQHEDGPEAHIHSPRRRSSFPKGAVSSSGFNSACANTSQTNANTFTGNMPHTQSLIQRGVNSQQAGYIDPFNANKVDLTSFFDWPDNLGVVGHAQTADMGKSKPSNRRANTHSKISTSDTSMPDYCSSNSAGAQQMIDFQTMNINVANADDHNSSNLAPKVPANTPTALIDPSFVSDLGIDIDKLGTPGSKFVPPTISQSQSAWYPSY